MSEDPNKIFETNTGVPTSGENANMGYRLTRNTTEHNTKYGNDNVNTAPPGNPADGSPIDSNKKGKV